MIEFKSMDEQQIQQKLADSLPKSEPEENPRYPEPESPKQPGHGVPIADYVMTNEVMDYFGVGSGARQSAELSQQMQSIIQWAKSNSESDDLAGILRTLRHTEVILGTSLKPDRLAKLYRYVRIQQQKAVIAEKERALYA